jgi:hypothetical protein
LDGSGEEGEDMDVNPDAAQVIEGIVEAYTTGNADGVLSYFAKDARVIGNLPHEDWPARGDLPTYLSGELNAFANLDWRLHGGSGLRPNHLVVDTPTHQVLVMEGTLSGALHGRPFRHDGRWVCVLQRDNEEVGWKVRHSQFSLI